MRIKNVVAVQTQEEQQQQQQKPHSTLQSENSSIVLTIS